MHKPLPPVSTATADKLHHHHISHSHSSSIGIVAHPNTVTLPVNEVYQVGALEDGLLTTRYHTMRIVTQPHMY